MAEAQGRPAAGPRPRIPFVAPIDTRDGSLAKDARLVNCYAEKQPDGSYQIYRRPGLLFNFSSGVTGFGFDLQQLSSGQAVYAVGQQIFVQPNTSLGTIGSNGVPAANIGLLPVDVTGGSPPGLLAIDQNRLWYSSNPAGSVAMSIVAPSWGTSLISPRMAQLDYTCYLITSSLQGSALIYGSNVGDPTTWVALNSLSPAVDPGSGVGLAKQLGYVVALKSFSTEVLYDAGTSPEPLAPIPQMKISVGCWNAGTIASAEGMVFWLGATGRGGIFPMMMEGGQARRIGNASIDRVFNSWVASGNVYSWCARVNSHLFYAVTSTGNNQTLVYDVSEGIWSQWTDSVGNYFPVSASSGGLGLHESNGNVYTLSPSTPNDNGALFPVDIYTPNEDFGVTTYKSLMRMQLVGDIQPGAQVLIRWNDHDYDPTKWTDFRTFDLSASAPIIERCGRFRRRAWHIRHVSNYPFRLESIELNLLGGSE